ncbi:hypothetical protein C5N14_30865 [Micromonospora sp. MW-13]|nr:hypothetical protein C5N14_30865 [Micromonospora sp. MW-13]
MAVRLSRLAAAHDRSKEAYEDDVSALRAAIREADEAGESVRKIAAACGYSPSHTHRIMSGLVA